jgi:glycine/D-amino acid oxidase-like deaminating enzyme
MASIFTDDFKTTPYWWERSPRPALPSTDLPGTVDVAIIGSGYTGLHAAIAVARGGRSVLVFDAEDAGWGCSSRNGGQISTSVKPSFDELAKLHGREAAFALLKDGQNALAWIERFVAGEGIDCDFRVNGRFHAAHNPVQFEKMAKAIQKQHKGLEVPARVVPRAEQHAEMGTDTYFGGVVFEKHASLDPALYHQGLLDRALGAGVQIVTHCPVTGIEKSGNGFDVKTGRGTTQARDVIVATNGYTGSVTPWLRRRVIPIGSYIIATEPLPRETVDRLMPHDRSYSDSRKVVNYYRRSPDGTRILFGGRVSAGETDTKKSAPLLRKNLIEIFPEMSEVKISHSWMGFVAYTFDTLAHVGQQDGLHYAMGYCGSGVSMASYMGMRVGNKVLGLAEGHTGSDDVPFQTRPLYYGKPWFLSGSVAYYRWRDRRNV